MALLSSLSLPACVALAPATAQAATRHYEFNVAAGPLGSALNSYARQTGRQLLYKSNLVAGLSAPTLRGSLSADQALARLLAGTRIRVRRAGRNVFVLTTASNAVAEAPPAARVRPQSPRRSAPTPLPARPPEQAASPAEEEGGPEIVVTGTHIRRAGEVASQVISIGRTDIEQSGYGTVAEVIASLPQNFGGTATEDTSLTGADRSIQNTGLGAGANLRGLGSDATLTLVNGRRLAGSGGKGDFADLSSIPTAAIERVEVLTDGASALYGSDAIGGVVNIILRKSVEGGETRLRAGSATSGGADDIQLGQLLGTRWQGGRIVAGYEYQHRSALEAADRRYTRSADLRPLGGSDRRLFFSNPGTILAFDPAVGSFVPAFAIPRGQDGTHLQPSDFRPGSNLENQLAGTDLLPRQTRHSGYAHVEQEVGSAVRLFLEGRYSHRRFAFDSPASTAFVQVDASNPYFVSPDGAPFSLIAYSFAEELGPTRNSGTVEAWSGTAGGSVELGGDWLLDVYATRAVENNRNDTTNIVQTDYLAEASGAVPDSPGTPFRTGSSGFFNPYGEGRVNSHTILDFVSQGYSRERIDSRLTTFNIKADGALFDLPGGAVRLAAGGTWRRESFFRGGESFYFGDAPRPLAGTDTDRTIKAGFAEILVPLFGPGNATTGFNRLELSAAVRHERYSDFGSTTDPKFGIVWEPMDGLRLRGSYGTSFRAPALREIGDPLVVGPTQLPDEAGNNRPVLFLSGGNPDLGPERARSLTIGARVASPSLHGLNAELNFFRTSFTDRIGTPAFEDILNALRDPIFAPFVTRVDPAGNAADRQQVLDLINHPGSIVPDFLPPEIFTAIVDGRFVNTARVVVRGLDANVSHSFRIGEADTSLGFNASYLLDFKRQITPVAPLINRVDTVGNPVDLRVRATGSVNWRNWGATASVNYVDSYVDDVSNPDRKVDSWTTVDLQLRYEPRLRGIARGLTLSLSVQNLFDADPPFVDQVGGYGYDAANADPLGRFVALQLIKRW
jgi:outer membrane receptor protein involved in Fe transport